VHSANIGYGKYIVIWVRYSLAQGVCIIQFSAKNLDGKGEKGQKVIVVCNRKSHGPFTPFLSTLRNPAFCLYHPVWFSETSEQNNNPIHRYPTPIPELMVIIFSVIFTLCEGNIFFKKQYSKLCLTIVNSSRFAANFWGISQLCSAFMNLRWFGFVIHICVQDISPTKVTQSKQSKTFDWRSISCKSTHEHFWNLQAIAYSELLKD